MSDVREEVNRRLTVRARLLARRPAEPRRGEAIDALLFLLGEERYAIETRFVREVARFRDFTVVPGAPEVLVGVTSLRGEILPVFDLRPLLGLARNRLNDLSRAIVLEEGDERIAFLADEAREIVKVPLSALAAPAALPEGMERALLRGVTADALIVLDGAALLRDRRLFPSAGHVDFNS